LRGGEGSSDGFRRAEEGRDAAVGLLACSLTVCSSDGPRKMDIPKSMALMVEPLPLSTLRKCSGLTSLGALEKEDKRGWKVRRGEV
jgi:hypothetical protein